MRVSSTVTFSPAFALGLLLSVSFSMSFAQDQSVRPSMSSIHPAMEKFVANNEVAGAVTLVLNSDATLYVDATGYSDLATKSPMQVDSIHWSLRHPSLD